MMNGWQSGKIPTKEGGSKPAPPSGGSISKPSQNVDTLSSDFKRELKRQTRSKLVVEKGKPVIRHG